MRLSFREKKRGWRRAHSIPVVPSRCGPGRHPAHCAAREGDVRHLSSVPGPRSPSDCPSGRRTPRPWACSRCERCGGPSYRRRPARKPLDSRPGSRSRRTTQARPSRPSARLPSQGFRRFLRSIAPGPGSRSRCSASGGAGARRCSPSRHARRRRENSSRPCIQTSLHIRETVEWSEIDFLRAAQVRQLGLREDEIRFDGGAEIGMSVPNVCRSVTLGPELEEAQQFACAAQPAGRVRPWVLDSYVTVFENRVVRADRELDVPFSEQMPHIEVETLADDLENEPSPLTEVSELEERLVDHGHAVDELQQLLTGGPNQRELTGHGLSRSDFPCAIELLDLPPLRGRECLKDRLGHVDPSDRPIEIGKDGPLLRHVITIPGPSRALTSLLARNRGRHVGLSSSGRSGFPCYVSSTARPSGRGPEGRDKREVGAGWRSGPGSRRRPPGSRSSYP